MQLNALGLIDVKSNQSTGGRVIEFIGLTQKGRYYLLNIKSVKNKVD